MIAADAEWVGLPCDWTAFMRSLNMTLGAARTSTSSCEVGAVEG
jgi:hypothetical protein